MKLFTAVGYGIMNVTVIMLPIIILILGAIVFIQENLL